MASPDTMFIRSSLQERMEREEAPFESNKAMGLSRHDAWRKRNAAKAAVPIYSNKRPFSYVETPKKQVEHGSTSLTGLLRARRALRMR